MGPEHVLAGALTLALVAYFVSGGADFGGGVWDLLATGPRRERQRALIERAIGPIWEANHVWLILAAVLLFGGFPRAFAAVTTALHVPLTLFLFAIVFRGSAFVFRSYDPSEGARRRWGGVFSVASLFGPPLLGVTVGAIASGRIVVQDGVVTSGFFAPWLSPFPFLVGLFALALSAFLAATYLSHDAGEDLELAGDFRLRALGSGALVLVLAVVTFLLSRSSAPAVFAGLSERSWSWPLHGLTAIAATSTFFLLWTRRFRLAGRTAIAQVALIILGWATSQFPYLVPPSLTLENTAANPITLRVLVIALAVGTPLLLPSLWYLFRVFKSAQQAR